MNHNLMVHVYAEKSINFMVLTVRKIHVFMVCVYAETRLHYYVM